MSILETVQAELKSAMLARDQARTLALRNVRAAFIEALKEDGAKELSDERAILILRTLSKRLQESIDAFTTGGRDDLVAAEKAELAVLSAFLPQRADEDTVRGWVDAAIAASGATSAKEMGRVMGILMKDHKDEMDGGLANRLVRERLTALGG